ncbi:MAG: SDR family NAD(P)-dependent oxidoreductase, partial [Novosphingobium sp.]
MKTLDQFNIAGRSALVTGAASGIGLAYAEAMAEAGAKVTLADIDGDGAEREAARLRAEGAEARAAVVDVSDLAQVAAAFDGHMAVFGGLDIAFANAGWDAGNGFWSPVGERNPAGQIDVYDPQAWRRSIDINLNGTYYTIREAVRCMKAGGNGGSIIATSSNAGLMNEAIVGIPYMPAKAGVLHL